MSRQEGRGASPGPFRQMAPVYTAVFLFASGEQALHVLISPYMTAGLGMQPAAIGTVVAVFGLAALASRFPVGAWYRIERARGLLIAGGGLCSLAFVLVPLFPNPFGFASLMAIDGVGWSIQTTTLLALLVASRPSGMTTASAMGWFAGFTGLGNATAGWFAGALADTIGFHASFVALALIPAVATAVLVTAMPWPHIMGAAASARQQAAERGTAPHATGLLQTVRGMPAVVWASVLVMFYINFVNNVLIAFHPILVLAAGLTLSQIGILSSCRSLASSTSRLVSGAVFARVRPERLTTGLLLLGAIPLTILPSVPGSFAWQVPFFLAVGVSRGFLRVTGSALALEAVEGDETRQGHTAALLHAGLDTGKIVGPFFGGLVAGAIGVGAMFRLLPLVLVALYALLRYQPWRALGKRAPAVTESDRAGTSNGRCGTWTSPS
ncbi:MAG: MFS transporter [Nitriliruptorales bacterium]|nr:MFS transporter [Nitriliruptorales bacterium]